MTNRRSVNYIEHMQHVRRFGRASLLALSLLSACAAADPTSGDPAASDGRYTSSGVYGEYLAGHFAVAQADPNMATEAFLKALAARPEDPELQQQAFLVALLSGRSEAVQLARQLPDNQAAQLLLGDEEARAGNWAAAEQRFQALPRQGLTQLLQPLLLAWAQAGRGDTPAALATLHPYIDSQRFRGIFALHAALIADLGGHADDAARLYGTAETEMPQLNLRLAQILASWQARSGHPAAAEHTLAALAIAAPDMAIALPALEADTATRPVARASDGLAETYLAFAAALRAQDSSEYAMLMLRLALDLRPGFTAARVLAADILAGERHETAALQMLAAVPAGDPLSAVVRMRRAGLVEALGHTEDAIHDLDRLAAEHPDSPLPVVELGDILRSKQRFPDAVAAYTRAITMLRQPAQGDWPLFYFRGIAYDQMHQWAKAEADFRHALALSPDQPSVLNYLGYSWADKGERLSEARRMIQKAVERRPNDGAFTDSLGWVMLRQGDVTGAVSTLERAVELEPEDSTLNAHLGDAYWAAGRRLEAQYQWRRALTLNPAPEDLAKLEAKLQTPPSTAVVSGQ
jgi:tetratricopeptide (TPR) repeat protein